MDVIAHALCPSETELFNKFLMRDTSSGIITRFLSCADVLLIFERLDSPIEELRRDDHCSTISATRGNLNGFPLRCRNVVTLLATEFGESNRNHGNIVLLVQVVRNVPRLGETDEWPHSRSLCAQAGELSRLGISDLLALGV